MKAKPVQGVELFMQLKLRIKMLLELNTEEQTTLLLSLIKYSVKLELDINEKNKLQIPVEGDILRLKAVESLTNKLTRIA